jgi:hypothetical protein
MNSPLVVLLRIVHISLGVFWAGTIFFFVSYLEPSLRALGPDGGKVMIELFKRRYLTTLPLIAALTLLSGLWLMWISSAGFDAAWMGSGVGIALSLGGAAALLAFLLGLLVMRPAALRTWKIAGELPGLASDAERAPRLAQMQKDRQRSVATARAIAALLGVTVLCMAVARYV